MDIVTQCAEAITVLSQHGVPLNGPAFELCSFAACQIISAVNSTPQIQFSMQAKFFHHRQKSFYHLQWQTKGREIPIVMPIDKFLKYVTYSCLYSHRSYGHCRSCGRSFISLSAHSPWIKTCVLLKVFF